MRVIVTRPAAQAAGFVSELQALGVEACALPLLDIAASSEPEAVRQAWSNLPRLALVMFVSANAVEHFFALRPAGVVWPADVLAACTGPGTRRTLQAHGVSTIVEPPPEGPFDSDTLWQQLKTRRWQGHEVLVVRGESGRDWLGDQLRAQGAVVTYLAAYRRLAPQWSVAQQAVLAAAQAHPALHLWHFSSSEAVGHLQQAAPAADWHSARAVATHARIAARAVELGFGRVDVVGIGATDVAQVLRNSGVQRHGQG